MRDTYSRNRAISYPCKRDKSSLHFLITERRCKRQIGAIARNGLIRTSNLARTRYWTHYLHARSRGNGEQRERNGQKATRRRGRVTHVTSDPSKMWDRTLAGSSLFFFSIANSPHASRGSWAPVYKGTRVLEMMAFAERRRKAARIAERIYTHIMLFILPFLSAEASILPFNSLSRKTLTSFSLLL